MENNKISTKAEAQSRVNDIAAFRRELARLDEEGALPLDAAQLDAITAHQEVRLAALAAGFDIDCDARSQQLSLGMKVASFLGALALAAAVFFLFRRFWGTFPTTVQVGVLVGAAFGTLGLTEFVRRCDRSGYFCKLAALVAFACFVLNIALLGRLFNITPSDKALLPWAAYAFLLAYRCDLRLLLVAGIVCCGAYIAARAGTIAGIYWLGFGEWPENFLPAAALCFSVPWLIDQRRFAGFAATYRLCGLLGLLLPILVLSNWGHASYLEWPSNRIEAMYQTFGFVISAAAIWLGIRRGHGETANAGVAFFVIFLYTKFYDWWWEAMPKYLFFLIIALVSMLLLLVFQRLRRGIGKGVAA
ncbi:MAG: DUF2157 domain-containing protein [Lysobacteraceae bacterium]